MAVLDPARRPWPAPAPWAARGSGGEVQAGTAVRRRTPPPPVIDLMGRARPVLLAVLVAFLAAAAPGGVAVGIAGLALVVAIGERRRRHDLAAQVTHLERQRDQAVRELARAAEELHWTRAAVGLSVHAPADRTALRCAAEVAHEVAGPLTGIVTRAELALEEPDHGARARDVLLAIRDDALRGAAIARSMLARARGESAAARTVNLGEITQAAVKRHRAAADRAGIRVDAGERRGLRVVTTPSRAIADPLSVEQIIDNLVLNAIAAAPRGGTVRVEAGADGGQVAVRVIDDGPGMDAATLARAFDPFFTTRGAAGTGLGLAVSRSLAAAQGGSLAATSVPGRGTTMVLRLPAAGAGSASRAEQAA